MSLEPQKNPDLFIIRGDSASINFTISGIDLTGATVFFTAKQTIDDAANDAAASIAKEVVSHTNPTSGITLIELSPSDTNITPGVYFYDIQVKTIGGRIVSIPVRKLRIWADVTRRT
jgi:hypothetical protein